MKIGLSFNKSLSGLGSELYAELIMSGLDVNVSENRLIKNPDIDGIDVMVFHPPYSNRNNEWDQVSEFIDAHQQTLFYMLALNAPERKKYFGDRENLRYINNGKFFEDPSKRIAGGYRDFLKA